MPKLRIEVTFDYVDPGSYLVHELLLRALATDTRGRAAATVLWHPLELRPPSSARMDVGDSGWSLLLNVMQSAAEAEGVPFSAPTLVPWTRKAHELAFHAQAKGCFDPVHGALFRAYFSMGSDISRVDALVALGQEHGLEAAETRTVLGVDRFRPDVEDARLRAIERDIRGVPTVEAMGRRMEGLESPAAFRDFLREVGFKQT